MVALNEDIDNLVKYLLCNSNYHDKIKFWSTANQFITILQNCLFFIIQIYFQDYYINKFKIMLKSKVLVHMINQAIKFTYELVVQYTTTLKSLIEKIENLNEINKYRRQIRYKQDKLENLQLTIGQIIKNISNLNIPIKFQIILTPIKIKFTNQNTKQTIEQLVNYTDQVYRPVKHLFKDTLYQYFYLDQQVNYGIDSRITFSQLVVRLRRTSNIEIQISQIEKIKLTIKKLDKYKEFKIQCSPKNIFEDILKTIQKKYNFYQATFNNKILPFKTQMKDLYEDQNKQIIIYVNLNNISNESLGFYKQQDQNVIDVNKRHLYYGQQRYTDKQGPKVQKSFNNATILSLKFSTRNLQVIKTQFLEQINIFLQQNAQNFELKKFFKIDVKNQLLNQIISNNLFTQIYNTGDVLVFKYRIIKNKQIKLLNVNIVQNRIKQTYICDQKFEQKYEPYKNRVQRAYQNQKNKNQKCMNKFNIDKYLPNLQKKFSQTSTYPIEKISDDQLAILTSQKQNLVVIGRSGTGKTITILLDILLKKKILGNKTRILFTTISPLLLEKIKLSYIQINVSKAPNTRLKQIPKQSFNSIPEKDLINPLFLSIDEIILLIDGMLHVPFLLRNEQDKGIFKKQINYNIKGGKYKRILLGYVDYTSYTQKRIPDKKYYRQCVQIDYFQFENQFIPSLAQGVKLKIKDIKLSSLLIWSQIYTFISGHANSYKNPNFMLNQKQYLNRVGARWTSLSMDQRKLIYQICSYYKQWKISKDYFDRNDIINYILQQISHKRLQNCNYPLDWVYIDEIQDFSPSFILMLSHFTARGFKLAGDTVQTIGKGKGFRLAQILYIFKHFNKQETIKQKLTIPPLLEADIGKVFLTRNYRSTEPIIAVANIILNLLTVMKIPFESAPRQLTVKKKSKIQPVMIFNPTQLNKYVFEVLQKKSQNKQLLYGFFSAFQAVIVRQSTQQVRYGVHDFFRDKTIQIYTVLQSKGLQFNDVILYNFFSSSQRSKQLWGLMNNLDIEFNNEFQQLQVKHNEKTKKQVQMIEKRYKWEFSSQLKELYVAITRARNRIFFYQSQPQNIKYIIQFLKKLKIIHILDQDSKQIQYIQKIVQTQQQTYQPKQINCNSSFIKKVQELGRQNFQNRLYKQALQNFKMSENQYYTIKCQIELLKNDHPGEHLQIAKKFSQLYQNYKKDSTQKERNQYGYQCAIYYFLCGNYKISAEYFLKLERFRQGAQCLMLEYNKNENKKTQQLIIKIYGYLSKAQIQKKQKPFLLEIYNLKLKIAYDLADPYKYLTVLMQINKLTGQIVKNKVMFAFKWYLQSYPKEIFSRLDQIVENQLQLFCKSQKFILLLQAIKFYFQILQSQTILFNKAYNSKHIIYQTQKNQLRQTLIHSFNSNNTKLDQSLINAQIIYMIFNLIEYFSVPGYKHYLIKFSEILRSDNLFYRVYLQEYILKPRVQKLSDPKNNNVIFLDHDNDLFHRISKFKYQLIDDLIMLGLLENNIYWRIKNSDIFEKKDHSLLFIEKLFNFSNEQMQNKQKNTQNIIKSQKSRLQTTDTKFLQNSLEILQNQFFIKKSKNQKIQTPLHNSYQKFLIIFINIINSLSLQNKTWFHKIPQKNILRYINILRKLTTFQYLLPGHLSQQRIEILYKSIFKVYGIERFKPHQKIKICQNISQNICIFSRSSKIYQTLNEYRQKLKIDSLREFHCYTFDIYGQRFCMPFYILLFYVQYNLCQKIYEFGKNYLQYLSSQPNSQSLADLQKQRIHKSKESQKIQYIEDFQYSLMIIQKISSIQQLMSSKFKQFTSGDVSLKNIKNLILFEQLDLRKNDQFRIYDKFYYYGLVFIHKIKNQNIGSLFYISKKNLQEAMTGISKYSNIITKFDTVYDIQQGFKAIQCFSIFGIQFLLTSILQKKAKFIYNKFLQESMKYTIVDYHVFNYQDYNVRKITIEKLKSQLLGYYNQIIIALQSLVYQTQVRLTLKTIAFIEDININKLQLIQLDKKFVGLSVAFSKIKLYYFDLKQRIQTLIKGGEQMYLLSKQFVFIQLLTLSSSVINLKKSENSYDFLNTLQILIVKIIDVPSSKFGSIFFRQLLNLYVCNFIKYYALQLNLQYIFLHKNWINFMTFQSKPRIQNQTSEFLYRQFVQLFNKIYKFQNKNPSNQNQQNMLRLRQLNYEELITYILVPIINFYRIDKYNMRFFLNLLQNVSNYNFIQDQDEWLVRFRSDSSIKIIETSLEKFKLSELNRQEQKQIKNEIESKEQLKGLNPKQKKQEKSFGDKLKQFKQIYYRLKQKKHIEINNLNYILKAKKIDAHLKFFISQLNVRHQQIISIIYQKYNYLIRDIQYLEFKYLHSYLQRKFKNSSEYFLFKSRLQIIKSILVRIKKKIIQLDSFNRTKKQIIINQNYFRVEKQELNNLKYDLNNFKQMTFENKIYSKEIIIANTDKMAQAILTSFKRSIQAPL